MFSGIIYSRMGAGCAEGKNHAPPTVSEGLLKPVPDFSGKIVGLYMRIANVKHRYFLLTALLQLPEEWFNGRPVIKLNAVELRVQESVPVVIIDRPRGITRIGFCPGQRRGSNQRYVYQRFN